VCVLMVVCACECGCLLYVCVLYVGGWVGGCGCVVCYV